MDTASLDLEVLGYLLDDYESAGSLAKDISRDLGTPLSESDVFASLCRLAVSGLAQAYVYDPGSGKYLPTQVDRGLDVRTAWFFATAAGAKRTGDAV